MENKKEREKTRKRKEKKYEKNEQVKPTQSYKQPKHYREEKPILMKEKFITIKLRRKQSKPHLD